MFRKNRCKRVKPTYGKNITRSALLICMLALLACCGKKEIHREGEGTNYPYTWQESKNGSILVTLDGSFTPEYEWSAENDRSEDASPVKITVEGKEKTGRVTYRITPVSEGWANVAFVRSREVAGATEEEPEQVELPEEGADVQERHPDEDPDAEEGPEEDPEPREEATVVPGGVYLGGVDEDGEDLEEELLISGEGAETVHYAVEDIAVTWGNGGYDSGDTPVDLVCRIRFSLSVEPGSRKGKFKVVCSGTEGSEYQGLITGEEAGISYRLWCDDTGSLRVRVPINDGGWYATELTDAKLATREDVEDTPGLIYEEPEADEDGFFHLVSGEDHGYVAGENAFLISGIAAGTTKVTISSPLLERQLVLALTLDENGKIKVDSVHVDGYTPDEAALEKAREREQEATREEEG
ncbi:MAG: hypothetical protein K6E92_01670 [Lachnospiraceae bacterium]|nr:hypothetical protein [Lachnospiraceae bacterium]